MDNLDPRNAEREELPAPRRPDGQDPAADREVPVTARTSETIHAWLDGEHVSEQQLLAAEKEYAFWRRVEEEAARRRRVKTPSPVSGEIMRAIKKE